MRTPFSECKRMVCLSNVEIDPVNLMPLTRNTHEVFPFNPDAPRNSASISPETADMDVPPALRLNRRAPIFWVSVSAVVRYMEETGLAALRSARIRESDRLLVRPLSDAGFLLSILHVLRIVRIARTTRLITRIF